MNKLFGYIERGQFKIGRKHHYMTKGDRERYFSKRGKLQKGRMIA